MIGSRPERQEMVQTPRKLIPRMGIDGLEEPPNNPEVHSQNMEIFSNSAPKDWDAHGSETQDHDFDWRSIFGCHAERCRVLVVYFVHFLIKVRSMQKSVGEVVPGILKDEKNGDLIQHLKH